MEISAQSRSFYDWRYTNIGATRSRLTYQFVGCGFSDGAFVLLDKKMGQEIQKTYVGTRKLS